MKANDMWWPSFDGKFVNYPRFKCKWRAYRQTYHAMVGMSGDVQKMIRNVEDLAEICDTLDTFY
jgi:hypothetical protein